MLFVNVDLSGAGDDLLADGLDVRSNRPFVDGGKVFVNRLDRNGKVVPVQVHPSSFSQNTAILRKDEWKFLDDAVINTAKARLRAVADLDKRGLVLDIGEGLGITQIEWTTASDIGPATMSMDGARRAQNDKQQFAQSTLPIPVIHHDYQMNLRSLKSSRRGGSPMDTSMAEASTDQVARYAENLLINGSTLSMGGARVHGYTTTPLRITGSLDYDWSDPSVTGAQIYADVKKMIEAAAAKHVHGPFVLYVSTDVDTRLDDDYVVDAAKGTKTIRQRIMEIQAIEDVRVADYLATKNVVMVEMSAMYVRLVKWNQGVRTFTWPVEAGWTTHMKVATIMVPNFRADFNGVCGILHFTKAG